MFARTQRLLLRPRWGEDALAITAIAGAETDATGLSLTRCETNLVADLLLILRTDDAPRLVGAGQLVNLDGATELRLWIAPAERGQGLGVEAGRAIVDVARLTLRLDGLVARPETAAAVRLLQKLGFSVAAGNRNRFALSFPERDGSGPILTLAA